jgi:HD domain-containing protein
MPQQRHTKFQMTVRAGRAGCGGLSRRGFLSLAAAAAWAPRSLARTVDLPLPHEVAGVAIPRSRNAALAALYAMQRQPDFLFNHCMRTFVFGALYARDRGLAFDHDEAFIAAAMHDLGLLPEFASKGASFEIDSADAAEKFGRSVGLSERRTDVIWHSVEMHDGKWALTSRQGPEAMLVAAGAAADVDGPKSSVVDARQSAEALEAFPRLQFKTRFTALLVDHCRRKPLSQRSTWLEGLCRETVPPAWTETVEHEIASAPFAE